MLFPPALSRVAFSAAARPSAIRVLRSLSAEMIGGQTNFMQNQTKTAKAMSAPNNVKLIFIACSRQKASRINRLRREHNVERNSHTDNWNGIYQPHNNEELCPKHR
ncbi:MAG: hypothetical protein CM1200mP18_21140 [Gammaproteobacteria bacterium]|nr:MAG: hypothetical protein CM1200mP18_21140 [Gammaproteobacteria bacterium]